MGDTFKALAKAMEKDEEKKQKFDETLAACAEVTNEDRCEAAFEITQCMKRESEARGLKLT